MNETDLDRAHAAMVDAEHHDSARLRFFERFAETEVFMLLAKEADEDQVTPDVYDVDGAQYALIFDSEERLVDFVGRPAPYAGLPGRGLVGMLAGQGLGLGLNLDVAPSAMLIPAEAVDWLAQTLTHAPHETEARLTGIAAPAGLPDRIVSALHRKLAIAAGLARCAYLAAVTYENGAKGHVLAFLDAAPHAEGPLAHAAGEALTFSGIDAGVLDVLFVQSGDPMAKRLAKVGLRFDLLNPAEAPKERSAPGMDPSKPPRLR